MLLPQSPVQAVGKVVCRLDLSSVTELACEGTCSANVWNLILWRLQGLMSHVDLPGSVVVRPSLLLVDIGRLRDLFATEQLLDQRLERAIACLVPGRADPTKPIQWLVGYACLSRHTFNTAIRPDRTTQQLIHDRLLEEQL